MKEEFVPVHPGEILLEEFLKPMGISQYRLAKDINVPPSQNLPDITITPFRAENQAEVKSLILAGLAEHWGALDPSKNPDLDDIAATYAGATFLLAWLQGRIVGTGALVPKTDSVAQIVRMSVAADMRRRGIGRLILRQLVERAKSAGYRQIVLETTATWHEVIAFYTRCGFRITHYHNEDAYFALDLGQQKEVMTMELILKGKGIPEQPHGRKPYGLKGRKLPIEHFVVRVTTPDNPFKPHRHEMSEVWYVLEGEGLVNLNGQEQAVEAGDLILLEPWVEHGLRSESAVKWVCIG